MKRRTLCQALIIFSTGLSSPGAQGIFLNLDFEAARVPVLLPGEFGSFVLVTDAVPGWRAYGSDGSERSRILHNTTTLDSSGISIYGPGWVIPTDILQGKYSVHIKTGFPGFRLSIGQEARVPAEAKSLTYWARVGSSLSHFEVSFAGERLDPTPIESLNGYQIFGADIMRFAGQTGELRFKGGNGILDNIQFSTQVIPEPKTVLLFFLGAAALLLPRRKEQKQIY